jgi:hypothetical protein
MARKAAMEANEDRKNGPQNLGASGGQVDSAETVYARRRTAVDQATTSAAPDNHADDIYAARREQSGHGKVPA